MKPIHSVQGTQAARTEGLPSCLERESDCSARQGRMRCLSYSRTMVAILRLHAETCDCHREPEKKNVKKGCPSSWVLDRAHRIRRWQRRNLMTSKAEAATGLTQLGPITIGFHNGMGPSIGNESRVYLPRPGNLYTEHYAS
jgi:hypothetical protein